MNNRRQETSCKMSVLEFVAEKRHFQKKTLLADRWEESQSHQVFEEIKDVLSVAHAVTLISLIFFPLALLLI